jgi:hypothetical protein
MGVKPLGNAMLAIAVEEILHNVMLPPTTMKKIY